MKTKLNTLFFLSILLLSCRTSIECVQDCKELGKSMIYETTFENAWAYIKKIFKEEEIIIREINKDQGSIFGKKSATLLSNNINYIGVWVDEVSENEINVTVCSRRLITWQMLVAFSEDDLLEKLQEYVDAE